ncbi:hypothetical protein [Mesorhizobium sp. 10J20-29]
MPDGNRTPRVFREVLQLMTTWAIRAAMIPTTRPVVDHRATRSPPLRAAIVVTAMKASMPARATSLSTDSMIGPIVMAFIA